MDYNFKHPVAKSFVDMISRAASPEAYRGSLSYYFGLNNTEDKGMLLAAYQHALKTGQASPKDFDEAIGNGPDLTVIISSTDPDMTVVTDYDFI